MRPISNPILKMSFKTEEQAIKINTKLRSVKTKSQTTKNKNLPNLVQNKNDTETINTLSKKMISLFTTLMPMTLNSIMKNMTTKRNHNTKSIIILHKNLNSPPKSKTIKKSSQVRSIPSIWKMNKRSLLTTMMISLHLVPKKTCTKKQLLTKNPESSLIRMKKRSLQSLRAIKG